MTVAPEQTIVPDELVRCPLCDYDLRGTTDPRCPECGYAFDWDELRDPARRIHPYAFEHHPERNLTSFFRTFIAGLRPRRFWRTMYPTQPSRPRRLILYWLVSSALCILVFAAQVARTAVRLDIDQAASAKRRAAQAPQSFPPDVIAAAIAQHGSVQAWVDADTHRWPDLMFLRWVHRTPLVGAAGVSMLLWVLWPWLSLAGLMIFQVSMRRARVRPIHVLRVVIYGGDLALWWALAAGAVIAWDVYENGLLGTSWSMNMDKPPLALAIVSIVLLLVATWRVAAAYRHYLRFPHAFATALAVQIIIAMLAFKLMLDWHYLL